MIPRFSTKLCALGPHMPNFSGPPQFPIIFFSDWGFQAWVWKIWVQHAARSQSNELILSNYCVHPFPLLSQKAIGTRKMLILIRNCIFILCEQKEHLTYFMAHWRRQGQAHLGFANTCAPHPPAPNTSLTSSSPCASVSPHMCTHTWIATP